MKSSIDILFKITFLRFIILGLIILGLVVSITRLPKTALWRVKRAGQITVITRNNPSCYYTYRDAPMGFEYDLAKAFSERLGVQLKIITPQWEGLLKTLDNGLGDFIAAGLIVTPNRRELIDFSDPYLTIEQVVVTHTRNSQVRNLEDLAGKTIHVRRASSYEERLSELKSGGLDIKIALHDDMPTEELIEMVATREIEFTVANSNVALLNRRYYPDIRIAFPIAEPQALGWAVKKGEKKLLAEMNKFFQEIKEDGTLDRIYQKYFANVELFDYLDLKIYHRRIRTRLPKYEKTIQQAAERHGFDWRLIAAMIYQESHFDPQAVSFTGVSGIMQLTQETADEMGVTDRLDPRQSIMGGVKYLKALYDRYEEAEDPDRLYIALAGYNVGHGHILDAQEMARQKGLDPNTWTALEQILPLLRYPKYYKQTKHGYARGTEPVRYVIRILTYYDILKRRAITLNDHLPFQIIQQMILSP